ncbi:hypothetical protein [[Eubacterium] cellulosolvens]
MKKNASLFSKIKLKFSQTRKETSSLMGSLRETFSGEIEIIKSLIARHPFFSLGLAFIIGLVFGGILQARVSQFTILSLLGGFPLAIVYGHSQGIPTVFSMSSVIAIDGFVSYALLKLMHILDESPRIQPYLDKIKVRYSDSSRFFMTYSGRLGVQGALAVCTFLIGWWIAVIIAYLMDLDTKTAMVSIFTGLLAGGLLSWSIYEGFVRLIPDPAIVVLIFLIAFLLVGFVFGRFFRRIGKERER